MGVIVEELEQGLGKGRVELLVELLADGKIIG